MAKAPAAIKNKALLALARLLREQTIKNKEALQVDNARDLERARAAGLAEPMVDRLKLSPKVLETCAQGCEQLAAMPDIIGEIIGMKQQPSGIRVGQMRVPIGVFGMIYESRPNVTIEAASLVIKSGNACILRGGSEAIDSNKALAKLVQQALAEAGLPQDAVQLVQTTDREAVGQLIAMPQFVDVIIPRGGKGLIERISRDAKVPVIKHLDGNCHTYVDDPCDIAMAVKVADNAKTSKYSPCNASEGLLVARGVAASFCPRSARCMPPRAWRCAAAPSRWPSAAVQGAKLVPATEQDWSEEYLAPIISVKVVAGWMRPLPTSTAIPATTPTPS
jgi:glutamate-5-semialdehyde dehydrogenase